jgi:hypothetical protein
MFAGAQAAARLLFTKRRVPQVNLYMPAAIVDATGSTRAELRLDRVADGLAPRQSAC